MKSIDTIVPRNYAQYRENENSCTHFLPTYSDERGKAGGSWLMSDFKMDLVKMTQ